jgi:ABC-type dipeptide/oligopeptide/nickel transport system permease component
MEAVYTYRSNWWGYILKHVLITVIAFFIISFLIFSIINLDLDGNIGLFPLNPSPEMTELMKQLGLYDSFITKYFKWIGRIFTGDWGESIYSESHYFE